MSSIELDQNWFRKICSKNRLDISQDQLTILSRYQSLLLSWNERINLISRKNQDFVWQRHILASVAILFRWKFLSGCKIIDVGTGGGLPGIPLAITNPYVSFTLLDSIQKKITAVNDIVEKLNLKNVRTVTNRAEVLSAEKSSQQSFDYIITRAVAPIIDIVKWTKSLLRVPKPEHSPIGLVEPSFPQTIPPGTIILLKGGNLEEEISQAQIKIKPREVKVFPLIVEGIDPEELSDKKIVFVTP